MKPPTKRPHRPPIAIADLRGIAQLATQATRGITSVSEGVHQSIWQTLGAPGGAQPGQTRGITGLVYRSIHGITDLVGRGVDGALAALHARIDVDTDGAPESAARIAMLSAFNGVMGDHLVASGNPLSLPMTLRYRQQVLDAASTRALPDVRGKILVMIHGLCMNDLQWRGEHDSGIVDHGNDLAKSLGYTPLYLRYNTGRHVSQNGHELSQRIEQLIAHWPVPVEEISFIGHSMGGLVARSACHHSERESRQWRQRVRNIVFLGTPHHGAPLERAGQWIDALLARTAYTAPFAALGQMRSAGITDLRHGHVRDEDAQGSNRFESGADQRVHLPLPDDIACLSIAATLSAQRGTLAERLIGDGLVPLRSALGQHDDPDRDLGLHQKAHWISYRTGHIELLHRPQVTAQIERWLSR